MIIDRIRRLTLVILCIALTNGCATVATRCGRTPPYEHFYIATRLDVNGYKDVWYGDDLVRGGIVSFLLWAPLITIDLPISLMTDTICLPCDAIRYAGLESQYSSQTTRFSVRKLAGNWVLLDRRPVPVCIVEAPTFERMNRLIYSLTKDVKGSVADSFTLLVSAKPFQGSHRLTIRRKDNTGVWYYSARLEQEFWLTRELFRQYRSEPNEIHLGVENITPNKSSVVTPQ